MWRPNLLWVGWRLAAAIPYSLGEWQLARWTARKVLIRSWTSDSCATLWATPCATHLTALSGPTSSGNAVGAADPRSKEEVGGLKGGRTSAPSVLVALSLDAAPTHVPAVCGSRNQVPHRVATGCTAYPSLRHASETAVG